MDKTRQHKQSFLGIHNVDVVNGILERVAPENDLQLALFKTIADKHVSFSLAEVFKYKKETAFPRYIESAQTAFVEGKYDITLENLRQALKITPHDKNARKLLRQLNNSAEAEDLLARTFMAYAGEFHKGILEYPVSIAVLQSCDRVIVSDFLGKAVQLFTLDGEYVGMAEARGDFQPLGLCKIDEQTVLCCDFGANRLLFYNDQGREIRTLDLTAVLSGNLSVMAPSLCLVHKGRMVLALRHKVAGKLSGAIISMDFDGTGIIEHPWQQELLPNAMAVLNGRLLVGSSRPARVYELEPDKSPLKFFCHEILAPDLRWLMPYGGDLLASSGRFLYRFSENGAVIFHGDLSDVFNLSSPVPTGIAILNQELGICLIADFYRGVLFKVQLTPIAIS